MAACPNLSGNGQNRLALLHQRPHQLEIVTICQADGLLQNARFSPHPRVPTENVGLPAFFQILERFPKPL